jgi:hypothetical protein
MRGGAPGPAAAGRRGRRVCSLLAPPGGPASTPRLSARDRVLDEAERTSSVPARLQAEPVRPARDPEGAAQPDHVPQDDDGPAGADGRLVQPGESGTGRINRRAADGALPMGAAAPNVSARRLKVKLFTGFW